MMKALSPILVLLVFVSCQKGDEDPSFTLLTRKSRLTGDWDITYAKTLNEQENSSFDGSKITYSLEDSTEVSRTYSWSATFTKEGTYTFTITEDYPADSLESRKSFTRTIDVEGIWEFTGGNNSPSKSQLALFTTQTTTTESDKGANVEIIAVDGQSSPRVYDMIKLSNKEMKLSYKTVTSVAFGQLQERQDIYFKKLK